MTSTYPIGYPSLYDGPMSTPSDLPGAKRQAILDGAAQRRLRVLAFVAAELANARPPSVREIADHVGVSERSVKVDLQQLAAIGWVHRRPGQRGLMVTEAGLTLLAERNAAAPRLAVAR